MWVTQFASVSSCARTSPLEAFQLQMLFAMQTTDDLGMPVPRDISQTVLWVQGWSSWLRTISSTRSMFSSMRALRGLPLSWRVSTVPVSLNFWSNLLMLLFVHPLSGNSVHNFLALYPFNWCNFVWESYRRCWKPCLQTMQ